VRQERGTKTHAELEGMTGEGLLSFKSIQTAKWVGERREKNYHGDQRGRVSFLEASGPKGLPGEGRNRLREKDKVSEAGVERKGNRGHSYALL